MEASIAQSKWVGNVGYKIVDLKLTVLGFNYIFDSMMGDFQRLLICESGKGNRYILRTDWNDSQTAQKGDIMQYPKVRVASHFKTKCGRKVTVIDKV